MTPRELARSDPHLPLAAAAALLLVGEWRQAEAGLRWPLFEAALFCVAFALVWQRREALRLAPLLAVTLLFQLAWIAIHVHLGAPGDSDPLIYHRQGTNLLDGTYPRSEYPVGAVGLFAFETWIGGGATKTANALTMVPFHLMTVVAVWLFRTRWSPWLAAFVALWPLNLFYWEFRFDLVPAACLVVGLLLAQRERWDASAVALSVGALVKWTPGLAALALALWLLRARGARAASRYALVFLVPLVLAYVPLIAWRPTEVLHAYTEQGGRGITGESLPFLPLRLLGLAHPGQYAADPATVPSWADGAAVAVQLLVLLAILALAARARDRAGAVALAAIAPVAFLLTNRIFSPQFLVVAVAAWAAAAALLAEDARQVLAFTAVVAAASVGNAVVYPTLDYAVTRVPGWLVASAAALLLGAAVTIWLGFRAVRGGEAPAAFALAAPALKPEAR